MSNSHYQVTGKSHFIKENRNGEILVLDDNSTWEVEASSRIDASLWLKTTDVIVIDGGLSGSLYRLVNTEDDENIEAKYIGQQQ